MATTETIDLGQELGLSAPDAEKKPKRFCVGHVTEIADEIKAGENMFDSLRIVVDGEAGGTKCRANVLLRPEWFNEGFNIRDLRAHMGDDFMDSKSDPSKAWTQGETLVNMYRKNFFSAEFKDGKGHTVLSAVVGGAAGFREMISYLRGLGKPKPENPIDPQYTLEEIHAAILKAYEKHTAPVGYTLTQQRDKIGQDDSGKNIYELKDFMEVQEFWIPSKENLKRKREVAKKSPQKYQVTFE